MDFANFAALRRSDPRRPRFHSGQMLSDNNGIGVVEDARPRPFNPISFHAVGIKLLS
jgi:hypothetical protein